MKRLLAVCASTSLLLVACADQGDVEQLPPEEVLRNAAQASLQLESVRYELEGDFAVTDSNDIMINGTVKMQGVLQDSGEQIQFHAVVTTEAEYPEGSTVMAGDVDVIVGGPEDLYVRLNSLNAEGPSQYFNPELIRQFAGTWWRFPSARGEQIDSMNVTPDPRILNAQAQVVRIVKDLGMSSLHSRMVYRYEVEVDTEKLVAFLKASAAGQQEFKEEEVRTSVENLDASGELWIDAETFYVQRLQWSIAQGVSNSFKNFATSFTVDFFEHDSAPTIEMPSDASEFTPLMFFDAPAGMETEQPLLTPEMEEEMIQQLLDQGVNVPPLQ